MARAKTSENAEKKKSRQKPAAPSRTSPKQGRRTLPDTRPPRENIGLPAEGGVRRRDRQDIVNRMVQNTRRGTVFTMEVEPGRGPRVEGMVEARRGSGARAEAEAVTAIADLFRERLENWVAEVIDTYPESLLRDSLAEPTVPAGLIRMFQEHPPDLAISEHSAARQEAMLIAIQVKADLRERAGGFQTTAWVADLLGVTRQAVDKRRRQGKLLAIPDPSGQHQFPVFQFTEDGTIAGLEEALALLKGEDPWEQLSAFVEPAPALDERTVADVLRSGDPDERVEALAAIEGFLE